MSPALGVGPPPRLPGGAPPSSRVAGPAISGDPERLARMRQDYETLCGIINQWNDNRLDLFALSLPNEDLEFHGVMRFYYQSQDQEGVGQKVATKCIRVSSTATTKAIIETLIEKFRPDMKMLEVPEYALYEIHKSSERRLNPEEKPLLVQLNWHKDDREGRFLLRRIDEVSRMPDSTQEDTSFKRKLSKREKKQLKKQEKLNKLKEKENKQEGVAEKLYTELPDTSFTRSISNPEAVMRRRRQQKLEKKLQQFRSKDGGPDTGGTLKIYGEALCRDVPYKTLLLSIDDCAAFVVEEMLDKYGKDRRQAHKYCLVQATTEVGGGGPQGDGAAKNSREYYLDDDECPLAILMNHPPSRGTVTFHVRPKPPDFYPRKRKKRPFASETALLDKLPYIVEVNQETNEVPLRFVIPPNVTEVGTDPAIQASGQCLLLSPGPFLYPRHCVLAQTDGIVTITPSNREAETYVNQNRIFETTILQHGWVLRFGRGGKTFRFLDPFHGERERMRQYASSATLPEQQPPYQYPQQQQYQHQMASNTNYVHYGPPQNGQMAQTQSFEGKENILPAVLEFREETEEAFFNSITLSLDISRAQFKLAPTYTIYMATRFRASTHYRPELVPEERAVRLTEMLNKVAEKIFSTVGMSGNDPSRLAFWMANASELLHFLKSDRHITSFSRQAQEILAETVHLAFKQLVLCQQNDLRAAMGQMLHPSDDDEIRGVMQVLSGAMNLLRKCRVNAALTIQLFSQLFHFINMWTFNQLVASREHQGGSANYCTHRWGLRLKKRLGRIEAWAEKQGLELAADCHLARVVQAAHLLQARKNTAEDIASVSSICFKLNSLQLKTLLHRYEPDANETPIPGDLIDTIARVAEDTVDEETNKEGREVRLEEDPVLQLPFLLPEDGYSCDIVRGVPGGLVDFVAPFQQVGLCVMTQQPSSTGFWTIYMDRLDVTPAMSSPVPSDMSSSHQMPLNGGSQANYMNNEPGVQVIQLAKSNTGMGLSIVAAKGVGKDRLGIYIKAVVDGGAAYHDGRLQAGDQLLKVDGQSLVGITQERAAEIMMQTGPVVELEVAKQGAIYHGLATLLAQPSPVPARASHNGGAAPEPLRNNMMPLSKSVSSLYGEQQQPTYQNAGAPPPFRSFGQSNSVQNLAPSSLEEQTFYQNVGAVHQQHPPPLVQQQQHHRLSVQQLPSPQDVFHASPRIIGTPDTPVGPEKPQRQYTYDKKEVHFSEQQASPARKVSQNGMGGNRVRFQEPSEKQGNGDQMASHLEQLHLTSVEREFRRRVAEYKKEEDSASDTDRKVHQLEQKRQELAEQRAAEEKILRDAERRRQAESTGSGNTPPPLPAEPPPMDDAEEEEAKATQRLDMLVGLSKQPLQQKRVSFKTEEETEMTPVDHHSAEEEETYDTNANVNDEKRDRVERVREDPNTFINEAESLLNSSTLALERFDFNKSTGHTPSVIGAQEVYRDPRLKRLQKAQEEKAVNKQMDGAKLTFKEKMKLFAVEAGESTPKDKTKISKAQREIEGQDVSEA